MRIVNTVVVCDVCKQQKSCVNREVNAVDVDTGEVGKYIIDICPTCMSKLSNLKATLNPVTNKTVYSFIDEEENNTTTNNNNNNSNNNNDNEGIPITDDDNGNNDMPAVDDINNGDPWDEVVVDP